VALAETEIIAPYGMREVVAACLKRSSTPADPSHDRHRTR